MNYQDKTKEQLIAELQKLQQENISLKAVYENEIGNCKQNEMKLQTSEARFRSYFELPLIGIAISSPEKGWIEANEGITDMLGYSMDELSGLTWAELTHPDDLAADVEQFNKVMSDQKDTYFLEKRFIHKNGEIVWANLSVGCVRKPDRSVDYMVALLQNISKRKQAEKNLKKSEYELKRAQQITHIGSFNIDLTTNQVIWTEELYKMYGFDPTFPPPLLNESQTLFTPESWELLSASIAKTVETGVPYEVELRTTKTDGSNGWMWARGEAIVDAEGKITNLWGTVQDITERKQAEEAIRKSEEKFRSLYANMIDGSALHTLVYNDQGVPEDYRIIDVNPAFESLLGISRETVINKTSKEAYGVDDPPYFDLYSNVALSGNPEVFETYFAPLDKYFSISVYCPYKSSFATIFENITERKKAENENERIQKLLEDSQRIGKIGGWEINLDTMELKWTQEMYNIHEVDLTFKPMVDRRVNFYTPESLPVIDKAFQNAIEQGGSYEVDSEIITAKGNRRSVKSIGKVDLANRRIFGLFQDITERKQAEKALKESEHRFRNNMEHVKLISVMLDTDGNITFVNNYFLQLTGWQREEILGQNWFEIFIPSEIDLRHMLFPEKNKGTVPTNNENEILTRTGERRLIEWSNTLLYDSLGSNAGIAGIGVDVTDRKQAEAELKIKNEQLKELNATKDKFFSIIAHDLKTPFSGILGFSEILKDEARNLDIASIEDYADILNSTAKQAFKLLENLLDWARMQQGSFYFEPIPISFNYLLKTEIEGLKHSAGRKNITMTFGTNEEINITADEKMLSSVLRNLISNAIKFTPKAGKINIEARRNIDHVEVSISDTGVWMEKETIEKLFKIETSFTSRGTENEKGTGLGLLLCKEFVEKHGGTIWVDSEKGKGSTFTFSIPRTTKIQ